MKGNRFVASRTALGLKVSGYVFAFVGLTCAGLSVLAGSLRMMDRASYDALPKADVSSFFAAMSISWFLGGVFAVLHTKSLEGRRAK